MKLYITIQVIVAYITFVFIYFKLYIKKDKFMIIINLLEFITV